MKYLESNVQVEIIWLYKSLFCHLAQTELLPVNYAGESLPDKVKARHDT